jgi:hypothetical protein
MVVAVPHSFCPVLCCYCSYLLQFSPPRLPSEGTLFVHTVCTLFVHTECTVAFPFCTLNVMRSVRSSHLLWSPEISRPFSARVPARSLMGSPRCDFTLSRKEALPARTRCVSRQTISRRISASGADTTAPNSGLFELVPSSSLPTRAHLSVSSPWNLQHPDPILPSLHDHVLQKLLLETHILLQKLLLETHIQLPDFSAHSVVPLKIIHAHCTFILPFRVFPCSLEPEKSVHIHDVTLLVHPRRHVNRVQFSFYDPTLPLPFLPAGASAHANFAVGYFILHPFLCFRLPLLFLASVSFSTEDSFPHVFKSSWCAVSLPWVRLAPHNPIFSCLNCTFAFLPPLFIQAIPQDDSWSLLVPLEPDCSSACIWEEGRSCHGRLSLQRFRRE